MAYGSAWRIRVAQCLERSQIETEIILCRRCFRLGSNRCRRWEIILEQIAHQAVRRAP